MNPSWVIVFLGFVALTSAGTCPRYPVLRDFDFQKYTGMWFQQDKLQSSWEAPGRCWKTLYLRDRKNGQFKMRIIFTSTLTNRVEQYDSELTLMGPARPSIIKYTIPFTFLEDEFHVLATDYETFSIEYKCNPNGILEKSESIFLLTRDKNPSPLVLQKAYAIMHRYGLDIRKLQRVDQTCGGIELPEVELYDYPDYEFQMNLQAAQDNQLPNRREFQEDDVPQTLQQQEFADSEHFVIPTDRNYRPLRRRRPMRRRDNLASDTRLAADSRLTLGQTLATRLWQVLHRPL